MRFLPRRVLTGIKDELLAAVRILLIVQVKRQYRNPGRIGPVHGTVVAETRIVECINAHGYGYECTERAE